MANTKRRYGAHSMPSSVQKAKKELIINISVLAVSLVCLLAGSVMVYADHMLGRIVFHEDAPVSSSTGGENGVPSQTVSNYVPTESRIMSDPVMLNGLYHDDQILNVLVIGVDDYQENDVGRSDSMMMVSLDRRHEKLKMTSFMRDMYLSISGMGGNRLNVAYSTGGPSLTVQTIENNFGVDIDRYVMIDNDSFRKIIDRLGGVTLEISDAEARLINQHSGESSSKWLSGGVVHMTGKQAHYYSRIRAIGDDFERTARQRKVLESIILEFKSSDIFTLNGILYDVLPLITTNMSKNEILALVPNALTYLNYPTSQLRIPADNAYDDVRVSGVGSVLLPDLQENHRQLVEFIFEEDVPS